VSFHWPLLDVRKRSGKPGIGKYFSMALVATGGTLVALSASSPRPSCASPGQSAGRVDLHRAPAPFSLWTVTSVLALASVMNLSGQTTTIGSWIAGTDPRSRSLRRSSVGSVWRCRDRTRRRTPCSAPFKRQRHASGPLADLLSPRTALAACSENDLAAKSDHRLSRRRCSDRRGFCFAKCCVVSLGLLANHVHHRGTAEHVRVGLMLSVKDSLRG